MFDLEDPDTVELIARSEQGLLFWLFSHLIEDDDWRSEAAAEAKLREAAEAVGFRHFDEVNRFQQTLGTDPDYDLLLRGQANQLVD